MLFLGGNYAPIGVYAYFYNQSKISGSSTRDRRFTRASGITTAANYEFISLQLSTLQYRYYNVRKISARTPTSIHYKLTNYITSTLVEKIRASVTSWNATATVKRAYNL